MIDDGIKSAVEARGAKYVYCSAQGQAAKQLDCYNQFITQDVDLVLTWPFEAASAVPGIQALAEADIPWGTFARAIPPGDGLGTNTIQMIPDNIFATNAAAEEVVTLLTAKNGEPKGSVLHVGGDFTSADGKERNIGFHQVFDKYPNITVTDRDGGWDTAKGTQIIADWFTANPETDAVVMSSDGAYSPAMKAALEPLGRWVTKDDPQHVISSGVDATSFAVNAVLCNYIDLVVDYGYGDLAPQLARISLDYLETGVKPQIGEVYVDETQYWKQIQFIDLSAAEVPAFGVVGQFDPFVVTQETADTPNIMANKYLAPPNGLSGCEG
jgi:ABC-type sugar transport system substrate-binding protein